MNQTQKTFALLFVLAAGTVRHGWRCLSALGGVFAKQKLQYTIAAWMLLLCTCSNPMSGGDGGNATISISLGSDRAAGKAVSLDQLRHVITFTGPTGTHTISISGVGTATATVFAGTWNISVEAYYGNELYAIGYATVEVKARQNTNVYIQMTVVWNGDAGNGDGGGSRTSIPPYAISLDQSGTYNFIPQATIGYASSPAPLTVTITNAGNRATGALSISLSGANSGSFNLGSTSVSDITQGGTDTFTVGPVGGLPMGTHAATVTVSGGNGLSASFGVQFIVNAAPLTYGFSLDRGGTYTFTAAPAGYSAQTPLTVTVSNDGTDPTGILAVALSGTNAGDFDLSVANIPDIATYGGTSTFTVGPKTGLAVGSHTATVTVTGMYTQSKSFDVSFTVIPTYTVTFNGNGGTFAGSVSTTTLTITQGNAIGTAPSFLTGPTINSPTAQGLYKGTWDTFDKIFVRWELVGGLPNNTWNVASDPVTGNMTLDAIWEDSIDLTSYSGNIVEQAVTYVNANAGNHTLLLTIDVPNVSAQTISPSGTSIFALQGLTSMRTIGLSSAGGSLFTVNTNTTLVLNSNITLQGQGINDSALVEVGTGGTLKMNSGSEISGNTNTATFGGGVLVNGGTFTLDGGTISGNEATHASNGRGGGVYIASGTFDMPTSSTAVVMANSALYGGGAYKATSGTFDMSGGTIGGIPQNSALNGGGVYIEGGTFTMNGGTIGGSTTDCNGASNGAGIYVDSGNLSISGSALIRGNTATGSNGGGGVYFQGTSFSMSGGIIGGTVPGNNNKGTNGGGVYLAGGTFTMTAGTIGSDPGATTSHANATIGSGKGGGVFVVGGIFNFDGGLIKGNYGYDGGGLCISSGGTATMTGVTSIAQNAAEYGGGVQVTMGGAFYMPGGSITGNYADTFGYSLLRNDSGIVSIAQFGDTTDIPVVPAGPSDVYMNNDPIIGQ